MEAEYGAISVVPPAITILLALTTRRVLPSLFAGMIVANLVLSDSIWAAPFETIRHMISIATDTGNFILIAFSLMVGGLLKLIGDGQGFRAFAARAWGFGSGLSRKKAYGLTAAIGSSMFLEVWSNVLVNGATNAPLYDRLGVSRVRLAYFAHAISVSVVSVLVINSWGAFYMGLLNAQGVEEPFSFVVASLPYFLFSWITLIIVLVVMITGWTFGPMGKFEKAAKEHAARIPEAANHASETADDEGDVQPRIIYMLLPLGVLLATVFVSLYLTGDGDILNGDGGLSILYAVAASSAVAAVLLIVIGKKSFVQVEESYVEGMAKFMNVGILIVFALSLGDLTKMLETGVYLSQLVDGSLPVLILPAMVFLLGAVMSFSTGTSYGTFSIMLPIALPLAAASGLDPHLMFGACIAGGLFGDNTSPISDTTIMTSLATEVPILDHVATQMPYALLAGGLTIVSFLVLGAI